MASIEKVRQLLAEVLELGDRAAALDASTPLLGNLPELDSMAVVAVITEIEERFGVVVEDDDIDAETFETLGTLATFVDLKIAA